MKRLLPFLMLLLAFSAAQCAPAAPPATRLPPAATPAFTQVPPLPTVTPMPLSTARLSLALTSPPLQTATSGPVPRATLAATYPAEAAARLTQLAQWGKGPFNRAAYSPDGRTMAVATSTGTYLYDAQTLAELQVVDKEKHVVNVVFSPDGQLMATTSGVYGPDVRLWRVGDGTLVHVLKAYPISAVAFSSDGRMLAGADERGAVLWQVSDGILLRTLTNGRGGSDIVAFAPDGKTLVSGAYGLMQLWRLSDGVLLNGFYVGGGGFALAFSPDGRTLAVADFGGVQLWNVDGGVTFQRVLSTQDHRVWEVHYSPDGQSLVAGGDGVYLWRADDHALVASAETTYGYVLALGFAQDGNPRVAELGATELRFWQMNDRKVLGTLKAPGPVDSVDFAPDGQTLVTGDSEGAKVWRVDTGALVYALESETDCPTLAAFSPGGQWMAMGSLGRQVSLWRTSDGQLERSVTLRANCPPAFAFAPKEPTLAWGAHDGTVQLWRLTDGTVAEAWQLPGAVASVAFAPDGQVLAVAAAQKIWLFQTRTAKLVRPLETQSTMTTLAFSPDGQSLAASAEYVPVQVWSLSDGALIRTLDNYATHLRFTPDGLALAAVYGYDIQLWRTSDGQLLTTLKGHTDRITGIAFSPDGARLASSSSDGTLRLWGAK